MENRKRMELEEALELLLSEITPVTDSETVPLPAASGRILSETVTAKVPVPSFPKAAMDGYAVKAEETDGASPEKPVRLTVMGESLAGKPWKSSTALLRGSTEPQKENAEKDSTGTAIEKTGASETTGTAVRIMTGAEGPRGYDAVVRQEDTDYGTEAVEIYKGVTAYTNYCKVGEDIREGQDLLLAGRRIGRIEAGVLASLGMAEVKVRRPLRITILSTGTELYEPGTPLKEGGIYSSIAYTLSASLNRAGFQVRSGICPDDTDVIADQLMQALETSDVILTTGGVSVGVKDLLPDALELIGAKRLFSGVNVQPGTHTIGSVKDGTPILSLSGNPYAAIVNFDHYFWPLAAKLTGCEAFLPQREEAILRSEYPKTNRLRRLLRARIMNGEVTLPVKSHASSVLSNLLECNCYIDLPAETSVAPGDRVEILRMPE